MEIEQGLRAEITTLEEDIDWWADAAIETYDELVETREDLWQAQQAMTDMNPVIESLEQEITERGTRIEQLQDTISQLNTALSQAEEQLNQQTSTITQLEQTINGKNSTINIKDQDIAARETIIKSKEETITNLNTDVQAKAAIITNLEAELLLAAKAISDAGTTITNLENTITNQTNQYRANMRLLGPSANLMEGGRHGITKLLWRLNVKALILAHYYTWEVSIPENGHIYDTPATSLNPYCYQRLQAGYTYINELPFPVLFITITFPSLISGCEIDWQIVFPNQGATLTTESMVLRWGMRGSPSSGWEGFNYSVVTIDYAVYVGHYSLAQDLTPTYNDALVPQYAGTSPNLKIIPTQWHWGFNLGNGFAPLTMNPNFINY